MKQLIIILLLIIAFIIGFGKYQQYKRYTSPNVDYKTTAKIDANYHDKQLIMNYHKAIESLNSFTMLQWSANSIDVRTPKNEDTETKNAVQEYADKLATIKYYETILSNSSQLKQKGLSNKEIKFLEETGTDLENYKQQQASEKYKNKITQIFKSSKKMYFREKSLLIFEVQKLLVKKGFNIIVDGIYKTETYNAIKSFEEKNNFFADGKLDLLTLEALLD